MSVLFQIICIALVSTHVAEAAFLRCYYGSINNTKELPLKQSPDFLNTTFINSNSDLYIVTHGYSAQITSYHEAIIASYMDKYNDTKSYCALNWKEEASAYISTFTDPIKSALGVQVLGFDYPAVSIIASQVARVLAAALAQMKSLGLNMEGVTLIGHSEGAHLFGNTGRDVNSTTGSVIGQIIGLDPAKPPFEQALDKTCAKLVYCVHTDPNFLGTNNPEGHIDFWLNYGCPVQPGCKPKTAIFDNDRLCSHIRALLILPDAVQFSESLQGRRAGNYNEWRSSNTTDPADVNFIGPNINSSNTGSFYLSTNAMSPFGQGPEGMDPAKSTCP